MLKNTKTICLEFCAKSSLHGVRYLTGGSLERMVWSLLLATISVTLVWTVYDLWLMVFRGVVMVVVENPHVELTEVEFPAITICPNNKVMKNKVEEVVQKYADDEETHRAIKNSIIAMSLARFPFYNMPQDYSRLVNGNIYPVPEEDIVDIMKFVGPDVDDVFARCKWRSPYYDCSNLFRKQLTEEGFCFSFNSQTAERSEHDHPEKPPLMTPEGALVGVRTNMFGRRSGLGFRVKSLAGKVLDDLLGDGYSVIVHNSKVPPDLTTSMTVPTDNPFKTFEVDITVKIVEADSSLYHLDEKVRDCVFDKGAKGLDGCLSECRINTLLELCGCVPYHRAVFRPSATVCGLGHLECLRDVNLRLRSARVTEGTPGFPSWTNPVSMNCTCLQSCTYTHYSGEMEPIPLVISKKQEQGWTRLRVIYKNYAVKYTRTAKYVFRDLVVGFGAVAGVLLGFSTVAVFDFTIYFCFMAMSSPIRHVSRRPEESVLRTVTDAVPVGRRPLGRPRLRWWDQVRRDMRRMSVTEEMMKDRERWRKAVGEAKNLLRFEWPARLETSVFMTGLYRSPTCVIAHAAV
ncbi:pickpocket protein 19-like [Macrosteles quadrilineatus]|uniref:pickpocket protein 19-like n=1 Tax=Macrosteles quadrilineatus TaxID=74068 RepID=UPI0023E16175|nr:pickpocket protein 19-like [Macrosteles quadrilineatus]